MLFFVRFNDKEYKVRVESRDGQLFVSFEDEDETLIDLHYYGHNCSFLKDNRVFYANVVGEKSDYTVWRPGGNLSFEMESEYRRIVNLLRGQDLGNENSINAKMPGKIVKISVEEGQEVSKGETVMVMEAMKMENEIKSPQDGKVARIVVKEGQAVESGELLLEFDQKPE